MTIDEITELVDGFDGVLTMRPGPGDGTPEIAWGDRFFYYAPDGVVPRTQPFATIVTKDYPDDTSSKLDRDDTFRLNISVGRDKSVGSTETDDPSAIDVFFEHPVYGRMGWVAVVNPGPRSDAAVRELLTGAYERATQRRG